MRLLFVLALSMLLLPQLAHPSFNYLHSINGSNLEDSDSSFGFFYPAGLLYDSGKLYVSDNGKTALYVMGGPNQTVREKVLLPASTSNPLENPYRMTMEGGKIFIADGISRVIKIYGGEGYYTENWNKKDGSNVEKATAVAFDEQHAYIADIARGKLVAYSRDKKTYVRVAVDKGISDGFLESPADVERYNGRFYVSDQSKRAIFVFDSNFTYLMAIGRGTGGVTLTSPRGFEIYNDRIYVADTTSNRVVAFTLDGYPVEVLDSTVHEGNFSYPEDLAIGDGRLFVADTLNRKIKVFEIIDETGNDSVLAQITSANLSLAALYSMQATAAKLNITFNDTRAQELLQQGFHDYQNYLYNSASSLAQQSLEKSQGDFKALSLEIELAAKKQAKAAQEKAAPARQKAAGLPELVRFDNAVADMNAKLAGKLYAQAADSALSLSGLADDVVAAAEGKAKEEREKELDRASGRYTLEIDTVKSRLQTVRSGAEEYRQSVNLSNVEALVLASERYVEEGDFESANHSIELANIEISAYETALGKVALEIREALANVSLSELELNMSASSPSLIPPDLSQERERMAQAYRTAYSNPQLAVAMANEANESASLKIRDAQAVSLAVSAVFVMVGLIAVIAIAFFIHLRGRRRHTTEHEEEKPKGKR